MKQGLHSNSFTQSFSRGGTPRLSHSRHNTFRSRLVPPKLWATSDPRARSQGSHQELHTQQSAPMDSDMLGGEAGAEDEVREGGTAHTMQISRVCWTAHGCAGLDASLAHALCTVSQQTFSIWQNAGHAASAQSVRTCPAHEESTAPIAGSQHPQEVVGAAVGDQSVFNKSGAKLRTAL